MSSERGFTLIELAVAVLIGLATVVAIAILGGNITRQRAITEANAAATSLAEQKLEELRANPGALASGLEVLDEGGNASVLGPYRRQWVVTPNTPATPATPSGMPKSAQVRMTVTHLTNPQVRAEIVTYIQTFPL
jgi:type II secretory pathway pseudopilin PulG